MDGLASAGGVPPALSAEGTTNIVLLKKSQDLMAQQAASLLAALPDPGALTPNPPGTGRHVNLVA